MFEQRSHDVQVWWARPHARRTGSLEERTAAQQHVVQGREAVLYHPHAVPHALVCFVGHVVEVVDLLVQSRCVRRDCDTENESEEADGDGGDGARSSAHLWSRSR